MANVTLNGKYVPLGLNQANMQVIEFTSDATHAAGDVITVNTPDGADQLVPLAALAYTVDGTTPTQFDTKATAAGLQRVSITSFDPTLRNIILTVPTGATSLAAGDKVLIWCAVAP